MAVRLKSMPTSPLSVVIQHLQANLRPDSDGMTDGELLARFVRSRDEDAIAALVRRHASMVWGVCRRLLNHDDAEDAFQATFLVLVRKATSVPEQAVANWLYGVARQTAIRLRATAAKRGRRETQVVNMPEPTVPEVRDAGLQVAVDEELSRLPDHYRGVIVLCDLEGMTRKEAARQLDIPEGSVASRLARARALLAKRLALRGVVFSGSSVAALVSAGAASASAPPALVASTIKAASLLATGQAAGIVTAKVVALTDGVVQAMFITKIKSVLVVVLVVGLALGGIGLGVGLSTNPAAMAQAERPASPATAKKEATVKAILPIAADATEEEVTKKEMAKLQGTWAAVSVERGGKTLPDEEVKKLDIRLTIKGDEFMLMPLASTGPEHFPHGNFRINPAKNPKTIDFAVQLPFNLAKKTSTVLGIYELDGDSLKLFQSRPDQERPVEFKTTPKSDLDIIVYKRVSPAAKNKDVDK